MDRGAVNVIYEDNHLLIVNKPAGTLVQGDRTGDTPLLELCRYYIKVKYHKPGDVFLGLVHRLDRPVSGAVIFAKTSKALERMNRLFQNRAIRKTYWAVVKRKPREEEGKLVHWLIKDSQKNMTKAYGKQIDGGQKAELHYKVLGMLNEHYLIEVNPITGRPHQIRVQLATMGCPIKGDLKYGFPKPNRDGNINLHAKNISFLHPVKKEYLSVRAGLPENDFWEQFLTLEEIKVKPKDINKLH